jgi:glycosyltransferase involved in cell wall biosynthesis
MSSPPTLSVLMPNYNHAHFLPVALQAILDQSIQPAEILIVDDASTDESVPVIEEFMRQHDHIQLTVLERNRGPILNMKFMLEQALGEYVCGAAADDMVLPGFFEKSLDCLKQFPQAALSLSLSQKMNKDGKRGGVTLCPLRRNEPCYLTPQEIRKCLRGYGNWIMGNTVIYRRDALIEAGGFIPELHSFCDGFICQVLARRHGVVFIPEPLGAFRCMDDNYSKLTFEDVERWREVVDLAVELMQSPQYRNLFADDYIRYWEKMQKFRMSRNALRALERQAETVLDQFRLIQPAPRFLDTWGSAIFRLGVRAHVMAMTVYFSVRYFSWLAMRQVLNHAVGKVR